jgi:type III secretion protein V
VRAVVPKPVSLLVLLDVLRRLVDERVSVRDLRGILESLSAIATTEKDPLNLAEYARSQMRRAITYKLTAGQGYLDVVLIDTLLEDTIRRGVTRTAAGPFLTLPPQASRDVLGAIVHAVKSARASEPPDASGPGQPMVILTQVDIRRFVRKLVETELPDMWVVSYAELLPEVTLKPVARASPAGPRA